MNICPTRIAVRVAPGVFPAVNCQMITTPNAAMKPVSRLATPRSCLDPARGASRAPATKPAATTPIAKMMSGTGRRRAIKATHASHTMNATEPPSTPSQMGCVMPPVCKRSSGPRSTQQVLRGACRFQRASFDVKVEGNARPVDSSAEMRFPTPRPGDMP
jgi:hypothetical protein